MVHLRWRALVALAAVLLAAVSAHAQTPTSKVVILSTTTSTQDSGLLDVLVPLFERQTGYSLKTISVGTGQALALAARGEADVTLAHAPALEQQYVADGKMQNRRLVMYNDFVIIGPAEDPARTKGLKATDALKRIAETTGIPDRGAKWGNLALVRPTWMPSVLTESLFRPIPEQEAALRDPAFLDRLADAHVRGIEDFLRVRAGGR